MTYMRKNILGILMVIWAVAMALSLTTVRAETAGTVEIEPWRLNESSK